MNSKRAMWADDERDQALDRTRDTDGGLQLSERFAGLAHLGIARHETCLDCEMRNAKCQGNF